MARPTKRRKAWRRVPPEMTAVRIVCVAGARPNFMKLAPLLRALQQDKSFEGILVHTGQHYDEAMSGSFFRDLEIGDPKYFLQVGSGSHAEQTAEIMKRFDAVLTEVAPAAVVVVGDVNSTAACSLVAKKRQVSLVHVEAGLRSLDRTMPEEINRLVTDAISDLFLVTEESGRRNLLREGVAETRINLVGNLMIDSLRANLDRSQRSDILGRLGLERGGYGVLTLHRPANVDDEVQFDEIMRAIEVISEDLPVCFPVHPRTRARVLARSRSGRITFTDPLGYLDFLCLVSGSAAVFTDSGGIQEETTVLGVPCYTLRENTERPSTVEHGTNVLAGTTCESILASWTKFGLQRVGATVPPLWDGQAAARSVAALRAFFGLPCASELVAADSASAAAVRSGITHTTSSHST
jgi:UDP-N-acetylglucosamine 2-epimerase (non-hydrolysing)